MKSKRKQEKTALLLDFVTARTPNECYHILKRMGAEVWSAERDVFGGYPHKIRSHFTIKRTVVKREHDSVVVQLTGTFTPVSQGTHVVGTITEQSLQAVRWWRVDLILSVLSIVFIVLAMSAGAYFDFGFLLQSLIFIPLILIVGGAVYYANSRIHEVETMPTDLMEWVTEKLYVAPDESDLRGA